MAETILITGASRGIGYELARRFAGMGWQVLACCRNLGQADELQQLAQKCPRVEPQDLDVTDQAGIDSLAHRLAGRAIDILFHNAGLFGSREQLFGATDVEDWLQVFRVNVIAPQKLTEALVDNVARSRRRIIAVMGSQLGSLTDNLSGGWPIYRSSKAAVHMVVRTLACDLKERGVVVVAFHPGWVRTRMGGPEAPLEPAESAAGLARQLLALEPGDTGSLIHQDGRRLPW
ncbi:NAD(P)-dependent dehydrogenase (short-subunit alcohol dehydrogenase family) [Geothermobacter ehrlichii]|uniref:NAD(P)-dependent dehydrogenase (Short-subunit alcohol dehydrogenase family) n=1 Tax=Geothermobacter ehrlichii TaxID=213224 RepID=A0A5D3WJC7_9BACT|nr:SDR family oxidoreductase [Geothermobacter ehrlichii]TYO98124.1 NAD(P)-dependent dehydrogenase (short-subunit alcohol dehydrogenase family) [Geothermobacter ehrlichii]